jgi:phosphoribosylformylglycinamidine synthase subunit PurL
VSAVHDISDGGLLVAVAEMALAGGLGASLAMQPTGEVAGAPAFLSWAQYLFGEDQGRYVVTTADAGALTAAARRAGVAVQLLGTVGGDAITMTDTSEADQPAFATITLAALRGAHDGALPALLKGEL